MRRPRKLIREVLDRWPIDSQRRAMDGYWKGPVTQLSGEDLERAMIAAAAEVGLHVTSCCAPPTTFQDLRCPACAEQERDAALLASMGIKP